MRVGDDEDAAEDDELHCEDNSEQMGQPGAEKGILEMDWVIQLKDLCLLVFLAFHQSYVL